MLPAWTLLQHVPADTGAWAQAGAAAMQARQRGRIAVGWSQLARAWRGNILLVVLELQHDLKLKYSDERRPTRRI